MKDLFNQFVDTLVEEELETSKQEIINQKLEIYTELSSIKNDIFKKIKEVQAASNIKLQQLSDSIDDIKKDIDNQSVKEPKTNEETITAIRSELAVQVSQVNSTIEKLATKMAEAFSHQDEEMTTRIDAIDQRVAKNETDQNVARDDHEKISMLLNTFASQITTTTTQSIPSIRDDQPLPIDGSTEETMIEETVVDEPVISMDEFQVTNDFEVRPFEGMPEATGDSEIEVNQETGQHLYK